MSRNGSYATLIKLSEALGISFTIGSESQWMHDNYDKCWRDTPGKIHTIKSHGNQRAYLKGCRCDECKEFKRSSMRSYRTRRAERDRLQEAVA